MRKPVATYVLLGLCVVAWLAATQPMSELWSLKLVLFSGDLHGLKRRLSTLSYPKEYIDAVVSWQSRPWNLVTSAFLHGGFMHLAGNMAFLVIFGRAVDGWMGSHKYVPAYLLLAAVSALGHIAFSGGRPSALVGASGAISGVMGLAAAFFPRQQVKVLYFFYIKGGFFEIRAFWAFVLWFSWDLLQAFVFRDSGGIAFMAHVVGFVGGFLLGVSLLRFGMVARHDHAFLRGETQNR